MGWNRERDDRDPEVRRRRRFLRQGSDGHGMTSIIRGRGSAAEKRRLIHQELLGNPQLSNRQVGYTVGCDHKTVQRVRRE